MTTQAGATIQGRWPDLCYRPIIRIGGRKPGDGWEGETTAR
jgi:hypothetical protein